MSIANDGLPYVSPSYCTGILDDEELSELDEIEITLPEEGRRPGEVVPVHLCAAVTEVGTLELQAVSQKDSGRWKIEFDVRAGE